MSHFSVMVIGQNPEKQLAPYDENLAVEEYETGIVSEEDKQVMQEYYQKEQGVKYKDFEECYKQNGETWNANMWRKDPDGIWQGYSRYNSESKWDWYVLGGRWSGMYILLKPGSTGICGNPGAFDNEVGIDQAYKGDIDFEAIHNRSRDAAIKDYSEKQVKCGGKIPELKIYWKDMHEGEYKDLPIEEKRRIYNEQDAVRIWIEAGFDNPFGAQLENYQCTLEEYVQKAIDSSFTPFAVVKDGEWYERGSMGWWGHVSYAKNQSDWNKEVSKLVFELPDDTLISIYDCHI